MVDQVEEIAAYLAGTCNSIEAALERFELDMPIEDVEEGFLDMGLERCPGCGWWMESSELVNEDSEVVGCDQCRKLG